MTDTQEQTLSAAAEAVKDGAAGSTKASRPAARRGSLSTMLLPELQQVAGGLGISTAKKKKSELVAAIQAARAGSSSGDAPAPAPAAAVSGDSAQRRTRAPRAARNAEAPQAAVNAENPQASQTRVESAAPAVEPAVADNGRRNGNTEQREQNRSQQNNRGDNRTDTRDPNRQNRTENPDRTGANGSGANGGAPNVSNGSAPNSTPNDDDDFDGGRRRGRRYRDRRGRNRERQGGAGQVGGQSSNDSEPTVTDDDVLVPIAGIVDAQEEKGNWFIRVGGYFATSDDVYIANAMVRRFGLRRGDAVTGQVKALREGERREKYNPLVRLDTVNGDAPDKAKNRVEFTKLTPLYPQERLRLETEPHILTTRVIDLVMPIGKGQRALIVSPPKAGKTMVLQAIANAIATNNPEAHLMVVLVDERPEEVTDMQRSVKGEVIASTFDRRPQDHITVAELSIERAKRLVEMGHDVVVLLDSITRLGRAYNLGAPASGRILSGGVDSTALYQPKRFLGAARNIENGGSLTIIATALVETGSAGDTVFFEEYKGTGNAELKLDRKIADKRIFPAIDVDQSSTRKEEILLSPDELAVTIKLRRVLHALESQQAIELVLDRLRKTRTNTEFLMQIAKTTPGQD